MFNFKTITYSEKETELKTATKTETMIRTVTKTITKTDTKIGPEKKKDGDKKKQRFSTWQIYPPPWPTG